MMNDTTQRSNRAKQVAVLSMAVAAGLLAACAKKEVKSPEPPPPPPAPPPAVVEMPLFPGGIGALAAYLEDNTEYPEEEGLEGVGGTVPVRFLIGEDGSISNIEVVESVSAEFDTAAVTVVTDMPNWQPGTQGDTPIGVNVQLEVVFIPPPPPPPPPAPPAVVVMPTFPGGLGALAAYLDEHAGYPNAAIEGRIEGEVSLRFLVGADGVLSNVEVAEGISPIFDTAAANAVSGMPNWLPGTQGGIPISVDYQLAVGFVPPPLPPAVVVMPRFPGGVKALSDYLDEHAEYPEKARLEGTEGTVALRALIGKDGSISNIEVVEGMSADFNASAIKAVSGMPKWLPGTQGGIPISVEGQMRVEFVVPPAPSLDALVLMPYFPGGMSALSAFLDKNLGYPFEAKKAKIEGTVYVGFTIEKDGSISDVEVVGGVSPELDAAALEVVRRMPDWLPGTEDGIAVSSKYQLPVKFTLP